MATLTLSNTVLNGSFAYADDGVDASGTFSAADKVVVGLSGTDTLGDFAVIAKNDSYEYTLIPADVDDAADLAGVAAAIVAAINEELDPTPSSDSDADAGSDVA